MKPSRPDHQLRIFSPSTDSPARKTPRRSATIDDVTSEELDRVSGVAKPKRVEVSLADIAPVIADAVASGRGWMADFANDTIQIDADLYEVLLAYQQMRRLDAA